MLFRSQFVIDTPSAREKHDIPPGEWRTPPDPTRPGQRGVRLVQLSRIRTSSIDAMMRSMPHYSPSSEARGLDFTCQFDLAGEGGGRWVMRVADERCQVHPGEAEEPDLTVCCGAELFLAIHREEASAVIALLLGRIRLRGDWKLFLTFPRILATTPGNGIRSGIGSMAARSAPSRTASTPARERAAPTSIPTIRACACGERTMRNQSWPGTLMSSTNRLAPTSRRRPSSRPTRPPPYPRRPLQNGRAQA